MGLGLLCPYQLFLATWFFTKPGSGSAFGHISATQLFVTLALATVRYKGNFLLLQIIFLFSQAPSIGKGEVREGSIRATVTLLFVWTARTAV